MNPDYIGMFSTDFESGAVITYHEKGWFRMFIEDREPAEEGADKISGFILDGFGKGTFEGTMSLHSVDFVKKYSPEAISKGGFNGDVKYKGEMVEEGFYKGEFQLGDRPKNPKAPSWYYTFILLDFKHMEEHAPIRFPNMN